MIKEQSRNYGIDVLKITSMMMVLIMHLQNSGGLFDIYDTSFSENSFYWLVDCLCACAVNCFALASGYVSVGRKAKLSRVFDLWFQVIFYSFILNIVLFVLGFKIDFSLSSLIRMITPVISSKYWYVSAFIPLCILKPWINSSLEEMSKEARQKLLICLFVLFTIIGLLFDPFSSNYGYSFLWIAIEYIVGYIVAKDNLFTRVNNKILLIIYFACVLLNWITNILITGVTLNYNSPTVFIEGLCLLALFSRLNVKSPIIIKISPLVLGVYLFHENEYIREIALSGRLNALASTNIGLIIVYSAFICVVVYIVALIIEYIRQHLYKIIRIPQLCFKLEEITKTTLNNLIKTIEKI